MQWNRTTLYLPLIALVLAFPSHCLTQPATCNILWTNSVRISFDSIPSYQPEIKIDGGTVHVFWFGDASTGGGLQYARSTDGGGSFSTQATIVSFDSCLGIPGHSAVSGNYIYLTYALPVEGGLSYGIALLRSTDAGVSWQPPVLLQSNALPLFVASGDSEVYIHFLGPVNVPGLLTSRDYGITWSVAPGFQPSLSAIEPATDQLHAIGQVGGNNRKEVAYYSSTNGGKSWIGPDILSVEDLTFSTQPSLAVNENGNAVVAWNDTGTVKLRRSQNGGLSWSPEAAVSEERGSVFVSAATHASFVGIVWDNDFSGIGGIRIRSSNNFGRTFCPIDFPTTGTAVGQPSVKISGNSLHLVWSEQRESSGEIIYRRGMLTEDPSLAPPTRFALRQNYPNPFNNITIIEYDVPATSFITLKLYDVLGEDVGTIIAETKNQGRYSIGFEGGGLPSGVYFYRMTSDQFVESRKLLILR